MNMRMQICMGSSMRPARSFHGKNAVDVTTFSSLATERSMSPDASVRMVGCIIFDLRVRL